MPCGTSASDTDEGDRLPFLVSYGAKWVSEYARQSEERVEERSSRIDIPLGGLEISAECQWRSSELHV